jgi:hypothetical protein
MTDVLPVMQLPDRRVHRGLEVLDTWRGNVLALQSQLVQPKPSGLVCVGREEEFWSTPKSL